jgi:hypothetical protein
VIIALFPGSFLLEPHMAGLTEAIFGGVLPEQTEQMRRFFCGIIGGTVAGCFLLQRLIVLFQFQNG